MYEQSANSIMALGLAVMASRSAAAAPPEHDKGSKQKSDDNPSTASVTDNKMGPAAFMWPPDRPWSGDMDNVPPCGSRAPPSNRAEFPLTGGAVALVAQDDYYNSKISISYSSNPTTNEEFTTVLETKDISDLNPGHTCPKIPDAPSRVSAGDNATIQIIYKADWNAPHNQTFYACADITYVAQKDFKTRIPCFNVTEDGEDDKAAASGAKLKSTTLDSSPNGSAGGSGGPKLGGGAIAGITIASVAGAALVLCGLFFLYRHKQQQKRKLRLARMEENARRDQFPLDKYSSAKNSL